MIFYFTGCGNSLLVAQRIAAATSERLVELPTEQREWRVARGEGLGVVCPVYFCGLPVAVREFLQTARFALEGDNYVFTVCTYGTMSGMAARQARRLLKRGGVKVDAQYSVRMVDVWTPMFDLSDKAHTRAITERSLPRIDEVARQILERQRGNRCSRQLLWPVAKVVYKEYEKARLTSHFRVIPDRCMGCGLCARRCPVGAIALDDQRHPVWTSKRCYMCLRCLHHCPGFAIQYGRHTEGHGQFVNPLVSAGGREPAGGNGCYKGKE